MSHFLICTHCREPLELHVVSRHANGEIQEATWLCPQSCNDDPSPRGWYCDQGTVDLGLVTDEQLRGIRP